MLSVSSNFRLKGNRLIYLLEKISQDCSVWLSLASFNHIYNENPEQRAEHVQFGTERIISAIKALDKALRVDNVTVAI